MVNKRIRWNGKTYSSLDEFCDEAGFLGENRDRFKRHINSGCSVDTALMKVYNEPITDVKELDINALDPLSSTYAFEEFCDTHNIEYREEFYSLIQTYSAKNALKVYKNRLPEFKENYNRDKVYRERREKQSRQIAEAEEARIKALEVQNKQRMIDRIKFLREKYGITVRIKAKSLYDALCIIENMADKIEYVRYELESLVEKYNVGHLIKPELSDEDNLARVKKYIAEEKQREADIEQARRDQKAKARAATLIKARADKDAKEAKRLQSITTEYKTIYKMDIHGVHNVLWHSIHSESGRKYFNRVLNIDNIAVSHLTKILGRCGVVVRSKVYKDVDLTKSLEHTIDTDILGDIFTNSRNISSFATACKKYNIFYLNNLYKAYKLDDNTAANYIFYVASYVDLYGSLTLKIPVA